jgi:O-antigen biosynthesis protein
MAQETYYSHPRPELLRLMPDGVRRVVDVGCGAGALGASIKAQFPQVEVRGIEIVPEQAERARGVLDDAAAQSADAPMPAPWPVPDCLIFADVLEHLMDPWATLSAWRKRISDGGWLMASLPNVGHASIIFDLLRAQWPYSEEGLLDRTHLRFFTRDSATALIEQSGFRIQLMRRSMLVPDLHVARSTTLKWIDKAKKREEQGEKLVAPARRILELCTYQLFFVARAST